MASTGLILLIGLATFFNFAIILHKFKKGNVANALLDTGIFAVICTLFSSSTSALAIGMIASMLFSIYLLFTKVELPVKVQRKRRRRI